MTTTSEFDLVAADTNVLVYAFDEQSTFHGACRTLLIKAIEGQSREVLCVTPQILAEFYAVVTSPRRVQNPRSSQEALDAIDRLLRIPGLAVLPIPVDIVSRWVSLLRAYPLQGSAIFDVQLVATMLANGVRRIYSFDRTHFERFREIELVTPQP